MGINFYTSAPRLGNEAERKRQIVGSGLLQLENDPRLGAMVQEAASIMGTAMAAATIIMGDRQILLYGLNIPAVDTLLDTSVCGYTIIEPDRPFCLLDAALDERFARNPIVLHDPAVRFYLGLPLQLSADVAAGALCTFDEEPRTSISDEQVALLAQLGREIVALGQGMESEQASWATICD